MSQGKEKNKKEGNHYAKSLLLLRSILMNTLMCVSVFFFFFYYGITLQQTTKVECKNCFPIEQCTRSVVGSISFVSLFQLQTRIESFIHFECTHMIMSLYAVILGFFL